MAALTVTLLIAGCNVGLAGHPNYRAAVTIINRTTADVTVRPVRAASSRSSCPPAAS